MSAVITSLSATDSGSVSRGVINTNFTNLSTEVDTKLGASDSATLTNKTIAFGSNTISGTIAQFNTALTDGDFATLAGTETLTNKTLTSPVISTITTASNGDLTLDPNGTGKIVMSAQTNFGANTAYFTETDNGNSSTADTIDWTVSNKQRSTLTGNVTYTFTAPPGPCNLVLKILTGTGGFTATWPASVKWAGGTGPTITTTANRADIITFYYDGTNYYGSFLQNFTP